MKNIPKKYHSAVRKLIKKAREEGYQKGRSDCPCLNKYKKTLNPTGIADFNDGEFYK